MCGHEDLTKSLILRFPSVLKFSGSHRLLSYAKWTALPLCLQLRGFSAVWFLTKALPH